MSSAAPRSTVAQPVGAVVVGSDFKALGLIRSLGRRGVPCIVVDDLPRSAWYSRYVIDKIRWPGSMAAPAFVDFLAALPVERHLKQWVLFPMQDEVVELVARNTERLSSAYRLVTQPWEVLRWAHDKRLAYQVAAEEGVACPRTWYPASADDLARLRVEFPVIVKPTISIGLQYATGLKALPARTAAELTAAYQRALDVVGPEGLMVQQVIPGDGQQQFSVAAYCVDGEMLAAMTARRRRQFPFDYGLSSTFVEAIEEPHLIELAAPLLRRLRLSGMVEVEFKRDPRDQIDKLLDINIRPWGWHTLCSASGIDFSYLQYCHVVSGVAPPALVPRYGRRWRRLLTDVPAAIQEMRAGVMSPWEYLKSFGGSTVGSVFDVTDPLPVVADFAIVLSRWGQARQRRPMSTQPHVPEPAAER